MGWPPRYAALTSATGPSGKGHPRELALAYLLDHAQGLRGAGDQLRLLEHLHDRHLRDFGRSGFSAVARDLYRDFRNALGRRTMLETRLEIGLGALPRFGAVKTGDDLARKKHLDVARVAAAGDLLLPLGERFQGFEGEQLQVTPHQLVGNRHQLSENDFRGFADTNVVVERLRHLLDAPYPLEKRHRQDALLWLIVVFLQLAPYQQIELLIGPPEFDVGFHRH